MVTTIVKVDIDDEAIAWLSGDECARPCAWRPARPVFARLNPWLLIGRFEVEVDFIGRRTDTGDGSSKKHTNGD